MSARNVLAIDIGGTKLAAGVVDETGRVLHRAEVPTPREGDAEVWFAAVAGVASAVASGDEVACGVGCGGPMTPGGEEVSPLNVAQVRGFPLRRRVAEATGLVTWVDNDAKALALGEGWVGAAAGVDDFIALVVSTGVGGGIVLDGRLLDGAAGNAGHIGHVIVEPDGRPCGCGAQGCLEAEASGSAVRSITGRPAAEASTEVRMRTGTMVGRAVASVANLLDLPLALVAGSVALGFGDDFFTAAQDEIDRRSCIAHARGTRIRPAGLGASGPIVGAAAVGWRGAGHDVGVR